MSKLVSRPPAVTQYLLSQFFQVIGPVNLLEFKIRKRLLILLNILLDRSIKSIIQAIERSLYVLHHHEKAADILTITMRHAKTEYPIARSRHNVALGRMNLGSK